jgi:endo-1,4-beta-xylanase
MTIRFLFFLFLLAGVVLSCDPASHQDNQEIPALQDLLQDKFLIGSAINQRQAYEEDGRGVPIIKKHYNTITPENIMKWQHIHPEPGVFSFDGSDRFVEFGEQNDMFIVGHTLVWHSQTPAWVFEDEDGNPLSREALIERMRNHIHTIVGRYKGRVHGWDVVNEAIINDGSMRETPWYNIIGEEFVRMAFEFAHEADPDAELYYNDYSLELPEKREGALRLVGNLLDQGAPITGVGTQGHFSLGWPSLDELETTITSFAGLGLDVMVTELDVDVLPPAMEYQGANVNVNVELRDELDPYPDGLPEPVQQELAGRYADLFNIFLTHRDLITRVTFWGVTDGDSWKNNWPVRGRTNYPLLFDRNLEPKPARQRLLDLARAEV